MTSAGDRRLQSQTGLPAGDFGPNLITPPGRDQRSALGLSRSGPGERIGDGQSWGLEGWRGEGGSGAADKRSLLFPHRSLHAGSLGAAGACAARASCRGKVVGGWGCEYI